MSAAPATFCLRLSDARQSARYDRVARFIGADASGAFGILAHHGPMVAVLRYGLARFADADGQWHYLAMPGGVLHFRDNLLNLMTEYYLLDDQRGNIVARLAEAMAHDDSELQRVRKTLAEIDLALLRGLNALGSGRQAAGLP